MKAAVHAGSEWIKCVSCGKVDHWTKLQGGHYVPRQHAGTRLLEENIHPQCERCNGYLRGNTTSYTVFMIDTYGPEFIRELESLRRAGHKWSRPDLLEQIAELKEREKQLSEELP